ncbi:WXG100 family type VII secretion target [Microbacterium sp. 3J1]|uniref:WXG100 family type VII secretion target n=1 Tax=Microbacterium sp. 3J1 TaxID=861269 RepID=UPI000AA74A01|nr:WXG100 family type VII secretion target [Microbacterium sp. 3J1]
MDLKIDPDRLAEAAAGNAAAAASIVDSLDGLAGAAQDLRNRWEGEAEAAFTRRSSANDAQWRMHAATLRLASERAARLAEEYHQADVDGARAVLGL